MECPTTDDDCTMFSGPLGVPTFLTEKTCNRPPGGEGSTVALGRTERKELDHHATENPQVPAQIPTQR